MKILIIHNFYQEWGGEDTYVTSLKKLLEENGHQVYLYSKDSKNIKTIWDKIKTGIGLFYNPWVKKELEKIIKDFKPDVAHFHNVYPLIGATAYRVCKKYKIPIIQHIHNYRFMCPKGILFRNGKICELCLHKKFPFWAIIYGCYHRSRLASLFFSLSFFIHKKIGTFNLIDKFIFPSEFTRNYYLKHLKVDKQKTYLLPYFVDIPKKIDTKSFKENNYFLFVGRLSEEKGIIELLNTFKDLQQHKLLVIGDGPLRVEVEKYKIYKNIKVLGFKPKNEIFTYIKKAKAVIISSLWYEVLPNVLIETILLSKSLIIFKKNKYFLNTLKRYFKSTYNFVIFDKKKIHLFTKFRAEDLIIKKNLSKNKHLNELLNVYFYETK
jgi:glycosyltransferase involved in cell wall biosynthesis